MCLDALFGRAPVTRHMLTRLPKLRGYLAATGFLWTRTLGDAEANGTLPPVLDYAALEAEIARHRSAQLHAQ